MSTFSKASPVERCFLGIAAFGMAVLLASSVYYFAVM
jgi:hypothetical protein